MVERIAVLGELDGAGATYSINDIAEVNEALDVYHEARSAPADKVG